MKTRESTQDPRGCEIGGICVKSNVVWQGFRCGVEFPHRTCVCVVNSTHNPRAENVREGFFFRFFLMFLLIDISKIKGLGKENAGFNEERVLSVCTVSEDKI
jgi:hypothetical protein